MFRFPLPVGPLPEFREFLTAAMAGQACAKAPAPATSSFPMGNHKFGEAWRLSVSASGPGSPIGARTIQTALLGLGLKVANVRP